MSQNGSGEGGMRSYWTAAVTRYSQEQRAAHHVERQRFQFYLPQTVTLSPKGKDRVELLFPGYIFVKVKRGWETLASTRGIARLFLCEDRPTRIHDEEIARLQSMEDARGYVQLHPPFTVGDQVHVTAGVYEGLRGVVRGMDAQHRCRVLLYTLFGRRVEKALDRRVLSAA
jgi:transcriptional antiterminator RfaH